MRNYLEAAIEAYSEMEERGEIDHDTCLNRVQSIMEIIDSFEFNVEQE